MITRQAVILIHGIGEQRPMDTLRRFVDAVWTTHSEIHDPNITKHAHALVWSKPDTVSGSFELRRLTTPQNKGGARTDFIEFYWAHMMEGTSYGHVMAWLRTLLLRRPSTVPPQLTLAYWVLWAVAGAALALALYAMAPTGTSNTRQWLSIIASLVLLPATGFVAKNIVGDAARYLHVAPTNVQRRHEIRKAGVALLNALHERGYDRIVIVGHSLGTVIGYDILTHAWTGYHAGQPSATTPSMAALDALEETTRGMVIDTNPANAAAAQADQQAYMRELAANGNKWRVTDFITLGSPLAHASVLMAGHLEQLKSRQTDREFPTCPPALETFTKDHREIKRFSFEIDRDKANSHRLPHHAAVFGPTRWTNLYFPSSLLVRGDLIGGPLSNMFGRGILDIPVSTTLRRGLLSHTLYWEYRDGPAPPHLKALRRVLNLAND